MPPEKLPIKSRKFRIYPNQEQKQLFSKCFGTSRYFYNKSVAYINQCYEQRKAEFEACGHCVFIQRKQRKTEEGTKNEYEECPCLSQKLEGRWTCEKHKDNALPWRLNVSLPSIRPNVMTSDKDCPEDLKWTQDVPYDTRQMAIKDTVKAYKTSVALMSSGHIKHFQLGFRTKKSPNAMFWVNPKAMNDLDIFASRLPKNKRRIRLRRRQRKQFQSLLPKGVTDFTKIVRQSGAYYLVVSYTQEKEAAEGPKKSVVSLDGGVRTFQSGYTLDGQCFQFGEKHKNNVKQLHKRIDQLTSARSKLSGKTKTKSNLQKRTRELHKKVKDVVSDLHVQSAVFLAKNFQTIILGRFDSGRILKGNQLANSINRMLGTLSHYRFRIKLKELCEKHGSTLVVQEESYTTKTCGHCGKINNNVGRSETFECPHCKLTADRDFHAARNICIKGLMSIQPSGNDVCR